MEFKDNTGQLIRTKSTPLLTKPQVTEANELFHCSCNGSITKISDDLVLHACHCKYAPGTSYYDNKQTFIPYRRIQINPKLTNGELRYNWFVEYESSK